ncbi:serine/threonine-protein kinase [Catenulispora yoronensis]
MNPLSHNGRSAGQGRQHVDYASHRTQGDSAEPSEAAKVGPYRLLTQLGSGAMGRVFLATDDDGRQAAVKVIRSDLAEVPAFLKRFARELDVAQRVHGPHIAEIYDSQPNGPRPWLATEYVPGPTLQEAIERGGCFDSARLRSFAAAVADALKTIHAADVVHRDLKPSNILLGADGPKVIDFGVARAIDASLLTNTGQTLGTPAYMSPEQADGRAVQSPSDVFALGALLVFAATGRLAFGDGPPLAILHRVVNNEPDLEGVAEDDPELRDLVARCLAKEPDDRPTPQQLIDELGDAPWAPLVGVDWQQPPIGVGLPDTVNDTAAAGTVALRPKARNGKRIAIVSTAAVVALVLAAIAVMEGTGGKGSPDAKSSAKVGESLSGSDSGGSFPSGSENSATTPGSSPLTTSASTSGSPSPPARRRLRSARAPRRLPRPARPARPRRRAPRRTRAARPRRASRHTPPPPPRPRQRPPLRRRSRAPASPRLRRRPPRPPRLPPTIRRRLSGTARSP